MSQQQDYKNIIINSLETLKNIELSNKQPFKANAYNKVLKQIQNIQTPIYSIYDLSHVVGIGDKIREKLLEIFNTGKLYQIEAPNVINKVELFTIFTNIHGIGPVKANELIEKYSIKSIEQLREKQNELLNDIQKKGLKYYEDFLQRIQRDEMNQHEEYILNIVNGFNKNNNKKNIIQATLTGSFRRGESSSGDIDVLITNCTQDVFQNIIQRLIDQGYITDVFARGPKKILAVSKLNNVDVHRRLDILLTTKEEYPFALLYFTGNGPFNVIMRNIALEKGYSLSEHGFRYLDGENKDKIVFDINGKPSYKVFINERAIFKFLNMKYIPPNKRYPNIFGN